MFSSLQTITRNVNVNVATDDGTGRTNSISGSGIPIGEWGKTATGYTHIRIGDTTNIMRITSEGYYNFYGYFVDASGDRLATSPYTTRTEITSFTLGTAPIVNGKNHRTCKDFEDQSVIEFKGSVDFTKPFSPVTSLPASATTQDARARACKVECQTDPKCGMWSVSGASCRKFLVDGDEATEKDNGLVVNPNFMYNSGFPDSTYLTTFENTLAACKARCRADPRCNFFEYSTRDGSSSKACKLNTCSSPSARPTGYTKTWKCTGFECVKGRTYIGSSTQITFHKENLTFFKLPGATCGVPITYALSGDKNTINITGGGTFTSYTGSTIVFTPSGGSAETLTFSSVPLFVCSPSAFPFSPSITSSTCISEGIFECVKGKEFYGDVNTEFSVAINIKFDTTLGRLFLGVCRNPNLPVTGQTYGIIDGSVEFTQVTKTTINIRFIYASIDENGTYSYTSGDTWTRVSSGPNLEWWFGDTISFTAPGKFTSSYGAIYESLTVQANPCTCYLVNYTVDVNNVIGFTWTSPLENRTYTFGLYDYRQIGSDWSLSAVVRYPTGGTQASGTLTGSPTTASSMQSGACSVVCITGSVNACTYGGPVINGSCRDQSISKCVPQCSPCPGPILPTKFMNEIDYVDRITIQGSQKITIDGNIYDFTVSNIGSGRFYISVPEIGVGYIYKQYSTDGGDTVSVLISTLDESVYKDLKSYFFKKTYVAPIQGSTYKKTIARSCTSSSTVDEPILYHCLYFCGYKRAFYTILQKSQFTAFHDAFDFVNVNNNVDNFEYYEHLIDPSGGSGGVHEYIDYTVDVEEESVNLETTASFVNKPFIYLEEYDTIDVQIGEPIDISTWIEAENARGSPRLLYDDKGFTCVNLTGSGYLLDEHRDKTVVAFKFGANTPKTSQQTTDYIKLTKVETGEIVFLKQFAVCRVSDVLATSSMSPYVLNKDRPGANYGWTARMILAYLVDVQGNPLSEKTPFNFDTHSIQVDTTTVQRGPSSSRLIIGPKTAKFNPLTSVITVSSMRERGRIFFPNPYELYIDETDGDLKGSVDIFSEYDFQLMSGIDTYNRCSTKITSGLGSVPSEQCSDLNDAALKCDLKNDVIGFEYDPTTTPHTMKPITLENTKTIITNHQKIAGSRGHGRGNGTDTIILQNSTSININEYQINSTLYTLYHNIYPVNKIAPISDDFINPKLFALDFIFYSSGSAFSHTWQSLIDSSTGDNINISATAPYNVPYIGVVGNGDSQWEPSSIDRKIVYMKSCYPNIYGKFFMGIHHKKRLPNRYTGICGTTNTPTVIDVISGPLPARKYSIYRGVEFDSTFLIVNSSNGNFIKNDLTESDTETIECTWYIFKGASGVLYASSVSNPNMVLQITYSGSDFNFPQGLQDSQLELSLSDSNDTCTYTLDGGTPQNYSYMYTGNELLIYVKGACGNVTTLIRRFRFSGLECSLYDVSSGNKLTASTSALRRGSFIVSKTVYLLAAGTTVRRPPAPPTNPCKNILGSGFIGFFQNIVNCAANDGGTIRDPTLSGAVNMIGTTYPLYNAYMGTSGPSNPWESMARTVIGISAIMGVAPPVAVGNKDTAANAIWAGLLLGLGGLRMAMGTGIRDGGTWAYRGIRFLRKIRKPPRKIPDTPVTFSSPRIPSWNLQGDPVNFPRPLPKPPGLPTTPPTSVTSASDASLKGTTQNINIPGGQNPTAGGGKTVGQRVEDYNGGRAYPANMLVPGSRIS